jgi:hypothetical protein
VSRRIESQQDLKDLLAEHDIEMAQRLLDHDAWVVWQRWDKDGPDVQPELVGPPEGGVFTSPAEAMAVRDEVHAEGLKATGWIELHGEPVTLIVPIWRKGA